MTLRAALLWALCVGACDGSPKPLPVSAPPAPRVDVPGDPQPTAAREISDPLPTAAAPAEGARRLRYRVVTAPAPASSTVAGVGELIAVGAAGAVIDLEDGTRVTAEPNSQLFALTFAKSLLLTSGQLHLTRLPDAERAGAAPARIASLAGALEMSPGADLVLRVEAQMGAKQASGIAHKAQLGLTRGTLEWFAQDDYGAHKHLELSAGAPLPKPAAGVQWWSADAQAKPFQALQRVTLRGEDVDRALDTALRDQEALRERGHVLLARVSPRHAALAKTPADAPRLESTTREYQRELVEHARRQQTQVSQLLLAAERSLLAALSACGARPNATCASLQSWSERFAGRVAELL
ncbi:MAG TPA: hypothetical protein VFN67_32405 [Polyangiales bacterium]|nr:hypothetical protein [Polyangiales bacterium]